VSGIAGRGYWAGQRPFFCFCGPPCVWRGVATGGHGAHPAPAVLGHGIGADPKFFGGRGRWKTYSATNLHRQETRMLSQALNRDSNTALALRASRGKKHLTAANCLHISGFFWGLGLRPWTAGDFRPPDSLCPP